MGCNSSIEAPEKKALERKESTLRLATSWTLEDTGLLASLLPIFEEQYKANVEVKVVGSGRALKLGESGEIDVAWVHSLASELLFIADGHGIRREDVMVNYFSIYGPPDDPAEIRGLDPVTALKKIADGNHPFVSRGDDSGTHKREMTLWWSAGGRPESDTYIESGKGMRDTLMQADRQSAYILSDGATYLRVKPLIKLIPMVPRAKELRNPYGIVVVNPNKNPAINVELAQAFVDFIISPKIQRLIGDFEIEGEPGFDPLSLPERNAIATSND